MMHKNHFHLLLSALLFFTALPLFAQDQADKSLPRASLAERFPSQAADAFLDSFQSKNMDLHSVMILKDGKVTYERWFGEHSPTKLHEMFSVSKTWTCMAAGFAIQENLFSLDDKIISFFPNDLPETVSENLAEMRIRDILTMSTGHDFNQTWTWIEAGNIPTDPWERYFFAQPVVHKPGTTWLYNSLATHMISALIQKLTGEKLIDYLTPRLFEPLGITGVRWNDTPSGVNIGGWGFFAKTEDNAKLGQLILQKGKWNGEQLLSEAWMEEATSQKILQDPNVQPEQSDSDFHQGYGFQIWRSRHNTFQANGMNCQFIIMMPDKNAVVIITADTGEYQTVLNLVWEHLLPALK